MSWRNERGKNHVHFPERSCNFPLVAGFLRERTGCIFTLKCCTMVLKRNDSDRFRKNIFMWIFLNGVQTPLSGGHMKRKNQ